MRDAENIAIQALSYLSRDSDTFQRFLNLSGLSVNQLREAAESPGFLAGVLDHIMQDESLLLTFSQNEGINPQHIANAHSHLINIGLTANDDNSL
ncbi:MAG: DUF3572 domain-containing protein [Rhizobiales bacterium]|nr:DUF3572 domain-containing protein [Hyphomicrobiales bacterium]